jgi:hypothetical protein
VLFLPFRRWVETAECKASALAAELSRANIPYEVVCEESFDLSKFEQGRRLALLVESLSVLTPPEQAEVDRFRSRGHAVVAADEPDWLAKLREAIAAPSLVVDGPPTVRAVAWDQPGRTIVHLLNLNVVKLTSFEDRVTPATDVKLTAWVPSTGVERVAIHTADAEGTSGAATFASRPADGGSVVEFAVPRLAVSAIAVIERPSPTPTP